MKVQTTIYNFSLEEIDCTYKESTKNIKAIPMLELNEKEIIALINDCATGDRDSRICSIEALVMDYNNTLIMLSQEREQTTQLNKNLEALSKKCALLIKRK